MFVKEKLILVLAWLPLTTVNTAASLRSMLYSGDLASVLSWLPESDILMWQFFISLRSEMKGGTQGPKKASGVLSILCSNYKLSTPGISSAVFSPESKPTLFTSDRFDMPHWILLSATAPSESVCGATPSPKSSTFGNFGGQFQ